MEEKHRSSARDSSATSELTSSKSSRREVRLPPRERALLADSLLPSLDDEATRRIEAEWVSEADERLKAHRKGEIPAVDGPGSSQVYSRPIREVTYRFLSPAENELRGAVEYYENAAPGLGVEFVDEIERTIARILRHPNDWAKVSADHRRCRTRRFPYGIIY